MKKKSIFKFQKRFRIEGTGKHTDEENVKILRSDLQSLETYLDDKDFFFGDKPTLVGLEFFVENINFLLGGYIGACSYSCALLCSLASSCKGCD